MDEPSKNDPQISTSVARPKPRQFSLRAIFGLTAVCAACLAFSVQFPDVRDSALFVVAIMMDIILFQVMMLPIIIGVTLKLWKGSLVWWSARLSAGTVSFRCGASSSSPPTAPRSFFVYCRASSSVVTNVTSRTRHPGRVMRYRNSRTTNDAGNAAQTSADIQTGLSTPLNHSTSWS